MWTELAKDLVIKEAIVEMDYRYEETENFFYVIEYLQYVSQARHVQQPTTNNQYRKMSSDWSSFLKRYAANAKSA